ncbi:MAG: glycoside hydrolase family 3 C-terminal domain-containing protein [Lachnospiraceae bacterium]|nr:glycoside hydrolase family 3 C-terminal domain-containing protein [Lachnospiraceae bacterium]
MNTVNNEKIKELIEQMTLEEKAGLCSGSDFWHTKAVERLGIPAIMMSDGPHGLRTQKGEADHLGLQDSIKAVCFPAACATASSFDVELAEKLGETLGNECNAEGVDILLGPAVNMKRSPLCGRNFEYYSEDPYLAGKLAASYINGVQSKGVGTSIKHFAANNQEYRRMSNSSNLSERAFREIYLPAFEEAVKKSQPKTVMCSYNKINGVFASENKELLTDILRKDWGFEGCVVTDWGAINDRVPGLEAGTDIEMPGSGGINDAEIVEAVTNGTLSEAVLDQTVERILHLIFDKDQQEGSVDWEEEHKKAVLYEEESAVLLENDGVLPIRSERSVAYIGEFAVNPRYQGGGSSHINSWNVTSALETAEKKGRKVVYEMGFPADRDEYQEEMAKKAAACAKSAEVAVIFAGLPDVFESEGYDRDHMQLPQCQNRLIEEICAVQKNVVVVLHNGSPVECPWAKKVSAVLEMYLGGEGVGEAADALLWGEVNPCGRLAETFPLRLEDTPSYLNFANDKYDANYAEDIFIGYRYYDTKKMPVQWAFGHGLSYTSFIYSNLQTDKETAGENEIVKVTVDVTNSGNREGKEVVQLYIKDETKAAVRPEKELKGFCKLELAPGETKQAVFELDARSFSWYSEKGKDWYAASGIYRICIGRSSREIACEKTISFVSERNLPFTVDMCTCLGDVLRHPVTARVFQEMMSQGSSDRSDTSLMDSNDPMMQSMIDSMPLRNFKSFVHMPDAAVRGIIEKMNQALEAEKS